MSLLTSKNTAGKTLLHYHVSVWWIEYSLHFYQHDAMLVQVLAVAQCLFLSVSNGCFSKMDVWIELILCMEASFDLSCTVS